MPARPLILGGIAKTAIEKTNAQLDLLGKSETDLIAELEVSTIKDTEGIDEMTEALLDRILKAQVALKARL